jgi:hypothetical protein
MAQFGNMNPEEKELEDIAGRILQNQEGAATKHFIRSRPCRQRAWWRL